MRILDVIVSAAVAGVVAVLVATAVNMAAAELQARLDGVCFLLLRLARRRLPADLRQPLHDEEWLPELYHILCREEARPVTRLVQGLAFSLGLLLKTKSVATAVGDSRSVLNATDAKRPVDAETPFERDLAQKVYEYALAQGWIKVEPVTEPAVTRKAWSIDAMLVGDGPLDADTPLDDGGVEKPTSRITLRKAMMWAADRINR
jgi:hypothetical protein